MDWGHAYREHQLMVRAQIDQARQTGRSYLRLASGEVRPGALSDAAIDRIARRDAEMIVNHAINQHNEEVARTSQLAANRRN